MLSVAFIRICLTEYNKYICCVWTSVSIKFPALRLGSSKLFEPQSKVCKNKVASPRRLACPCTYILYMLDTKKQTDLQKRDLPSLPSPWQISNIML